MNPEWLVPASYVAFLNQVFPGQWDRAAYDWYIARSFNGLESDLLVVTEGCRVLAGIALCHREVLVGSTDRIAVRVICAAATLPSERGRGHYGRLLMAAREHCLQRGYSALLGFVTRDNFSGKGLSDRGARGIPSFYVTSGRRPPDRSRAIRDRIKVPCGPPAESSGRIGSTLAALVRQNSVAASAADGRDARFHYERTHDWRQQFIHRPNRVRVLRLAHDRIALVETVGSTDRLQWLACPPGKFGTSVTMLANASAAAGRNFFMYTLDPLLAQAAMRAGLKARPGYLMLWATGHSSRERDALARASWRLQSGDRV